MRSLAFDGDFELRSLYGWRTDPITGVRTYHDGIDVGTPIGVPIKARESGYARRIRRDDYGGLYIQIKMSDGRGYWQLHLDRTDPAIKEGQYVVKGQVIAYSGNSGRSTGAHTHFGLQSNAEVWNSNIDPLAFFKLDIEPPRFKKGDKLVFTDIQNIREGSSKLYVVKRQSQPGEIFVVFDEPRQADGYNWYDTGNGWAADVKKFELYVEPAPIPVPEPIPEPTPEPTPEPPTTPPTDQTPSTPPTDPDSETDTNPEPSSGFEDIIISILTFLKEVVAKIKELLKM